MTTWIECNHPWVKSKSQASMGEEEIRVGSVITGFVLVQSPPQDPQILCNYGRIYNCHLSRDFPRFSDGRGPPQGRLPCVTSSDQIEILAKPTTPYLGHLLVRSRSSEGMEDNRVIVVPV
jgi:hypothetical protein